MTSPFGRESISSTDAVKAATSLTFAIVTVTWTTSPSYGGIGLTEGLASPRSGATCDTTGGVAPAIPAAAIRKKPIPRANIHPLRRPPRGGAHHARPTDLDVSSGEYYYRASVVFMIPHRMRRPANRSRPHKPQYAAPVRTPVGRDSARKSA